MQGSYFEWEKSVCWCVCEDISLRGKKRESVCVCERERERERKKERERM